MQKVPCNFTVECVVWREVLSTIYGSFIGYPDSGWSHTLMSLRAFARVCVIRFFTSETCVLLLFSPTLPLPVERHRSLVQRLSTSFTSKHTKYNSTAHSTPYRQRNIEVSGRVLHIPLNNCNLLFSLRIHPTSASFKATK